MIANESGVSFLVRAYMLVVHVHVNRIVMVPHVPSLTIIQLVCYSNLPFIIEHHVRSHTTDYILRLMDSNNADSEN